jgi:hypothetical protein
MYKTTINSLILIISFFLYKFTNYKFLKYFLSIKLYLVEVLHIERWIIEFTEGKNNKSTLGIE